jgi:CRP-like cAMP-binding protein
MNRTHCPQECQSCSARFQGIFSDLDGEALESLNRAKSSHQYGKGETIFNQGNDPDGLYCVGKGKVKLVNSVIEGKSTIMRIVTPGDVFGHRALFTKSQHTTAAIAIEPSEVCFLNKSFIQDLIKKDPDTNQRLIEYLSKTITEQDDRISSLSQKTARARLAELLLDLADKHGQSYDGGIRINIRLTREDMAALVGTAPESLIRLLSDFKAMKLVVQSGRTMILHDMKGLRKEAGISVIS